MLKLARDVNAEFIARGDVYKKQEFWDEVSREVPGEARRGVRRVLSAGLEAPTAFRPPRVARLLALMAGFQAA
jgi:hypothetical protein